MHTAAPWFPYKNPSYKHISRFYRILRSDFFRNADFPKRQVFFYVATKSVRTDHGFVVLINSTSVVSLTLVFIT